MKKPTCLQCPNAPLEELSKAKVLNNRTRKSYYRRRYVCRICGTEYTFYANGSHDLEEEEVRAKREVDNYFRQQENNQRR